MATSEQLEIPEGSMQPKPACSPDRDLVLDLSSKTITTSFRNLKNASVLTKHFAASLFMGPLEEGEINWGALIDEMGYAEMLAAKQTLKDLGMVNQFDVLGSPGGISLNQTFDLEGMINDLERKLR